MNGGQPNPSPWRHELDSEDPETRAEAVLNLAREEGREAEPEVLGRLSDSSLLVRIAALVACWELGAELRHPEYVVEGLHSPDENTRALAVEALSMLGERLLPVLKEAFEASGGRDVIYPRALAEIESPAAQRELERLVRDLGGDVADEARQALGL